MATTFTVPGVYFEDRQTVSTELQPADISIAGFIGITESGPINEPVKVNSLKAFQDIFGGFLDSSDLPHMVNSYFAAGGRELYVNRVAHYTDITDASSEAGAKSALATIQDQDATPEDTLTIQAKYKGTYGDRYAVSLTNNPLHTSATSADAASGQKVVQITTPNKLYSGQVLKLKGLTPEPTTLAEALAKANALKAAYNAHLADTTVHLSADAVNVATAPNATDQASLDTLLDDMITVYPTHLSSVVFHTAADGVNGIVEGPSDGTLATAIDIINDFEAKFEAHILREASHVAADTTNTSQKTEYRKVDTFTSAVSAGTVVHSVTFTENLTNSFDSGAVVNSLEFDIRVFNTELVTVDPVETFVGLSIESDVPNYVVTALADTVFGSKVIEAVDEGSTSGKGLDTPQNVVKTNLSSGADPTTGLALTDLIGDATTETGLYAFSAIDDVSTIVFAPASGKAFTYSSVLIQACNTLAEQERRFFFLFEPDPSLTGTQASLANQAGGYDMRFGAMFTPRIKVKDVSKTDGSTRLISPLGAVAGLISRVDNSDVSGPWQPPAGDQWGRINEAVGVETQFSQEVLGDLNVNGKINVIRPMRGRGVQVMGARSLANSRKFRYLSVGRLYLFVVVSVKQDSEALVFLPNTAGTWGLLTGRIVEFLNDLRGVGALQGNSPQESFTVRIGENAGVQTASDTQEGIMRGEISFAPVKPAEFIVFGINTSDGVITIQ